MRLQVLWCKLASTLVQACKYVLASTRFIYCKEEVAERGEQPSEVVARKVVLLGAIKRVGRDAPAPPLVKQDIFMSKDRLFLLDAYALIYRAYFPHSKRPRLDRQGRDTSAVFGFANTLSELLAQVQPEYVAVVFDPPGGSFRNQEYEAYKAHRPETPEAIRFGVPYIKQIIEAYGIPVVEVAGYEADDVIGTLAQQGASVGLEVFMVTSDKDYAQLVTPHVVMYRPINGGGYEEWGEREVCEQFGLESPKQMIDYLGMVGDAADNLPGIAGIGPKTAIELLQRYGTLDNVLSHAHEQKGKLAQKIEQGREHALLTRRLATICTDVPIQINLSAMRRKAADLDRLTALFREFDFNSLIARVKARHEAERVKGLSNLFEEAEEVVAQPQDCEGLELFAMQYPEGKEVTQATIYTGEEGMEPVCTEVAFDLILLDSSDAIADFMKEVEGSSVLAFEAITTSTDALRAELVGLSFVLDTQRAYYLPLPQEHEEADTILRSLIPVFESDKLKVGQNIKYDMQVLANCGIELGGPLFDTMVAHYLLMPEMGHALEALSLRYLGYRLMSFEELVSPQKAKGANIRSVSLERLSLYAAEAAHIAFRLYEYFAPRLKERGQEKLMRDLEMPLVGILARMEREGVRIDVEELRQQSERLNRELKEVEQELYVLAGRKFNVNSSKQVGEVLFDELQIVAKAKKTKKGGYATGEEVLEKLSGKHPIVDRILHYRAIKKLLSTYIDALPEMCYEDGKLHSSFNQTIAATGRLSSSNPNIQNIPIRTELGRSIRAAFVPSSEDCVFLSADYSQIELRLMAHFSEDTALIEAFRLGQDIHQATAARINNADLSEVTEEMRRQAKTANFGIIYGISSFGLAERLGISRSESKALINGYFTSYPGVKTYMEQVVKEAQTKGYVTTLLGRRRYLPDINSTNSVLRGYAERNAINAPLQGTAADIIKIAMIHIDEAIRERGLRSRMILQVHDELSFNVYRDELEEMQNLVYTSMREALPVLSVPLEIEIGFGKTWLEAH